MQHSVQNWNAKADQVIVHRISNERIEVTSPTGEGLLAGSPLEMAYLAHAVQLAIAGESRRMLASAQGVAMEP